MNSQLEETACLYVLDRLDTGERAAFEARLSREAELAALTREIEASLARRIHALPRHEPPAGALAQIEARIDRLQEGRSRPPPRGTLPLWAAAARWGIAAVIAVSVSIVAVQSLRRPAAAAQPYVIVVGLDSLRSTQAEFPVGDRPEGADARFIQLASLAEKFWEKPDDLPVRLGPSGQGGRGYALFDPGSNQGFIAIRQLPAADRGKEYHLWLVDTSTGRVSEAGILPVAGSTRGLYFFSVAPPAQGNPGRPDFFVTAEDAGSAPAAQPRGRVVLGNERI
jgi:anti-sigma-K factor RskA